jgi:hypothetical protein
MATATATEPRYLRVGGQKIRVLWRHEFLTQYWDYKPGQHVSLIAPSQDGKTTLAFQLLAHTATPKLPAIVFVMKPRDPTPAAWASHLGYPESESWPPEQLQRMRLPWQNRDDKPSGYVLWPRHTFVVEVDKATMAREFRKALNWAYSHGDCIVFADEIYGLIAELDLQDEAIAIWSRGSGMHCGLWGATQRPSGSQGKGVPGFMYSNSWHLFFSRDPDVRSRQRYGEIGGVDPRLLAAVIDKLKLHQFLWINKGDGKGGPYLAIIDAK